MKRFMVYTESAGYLSKSAIVAENKKEAEELFTKQVEVVAVKDVTDDYVISESQLRESLESGGFGVYEIEFIIQSVNKCGGVV